MAEELRSTSKEFPGFGCKRTFVNATLGGSLTQCWSSEKPSPGSHRRQQPVPYLPLYSSDPPTEDCKTLCPKCLEVAIRDYFQWSRFMSLRHIPKLMMANKRDPPKSRGPMENVVLMTLDILPQAQNPDVFGNRSVDVPPFRIPFLIDNWSSMILDFEVAESPSQVRGQLSARAYLGMIERHQRIPFHLSHAVEFETEVPNVLAGHSSLRELNVTRELPWLDQIYTPYSDEREMRIHLSSHTAAMIDRMDEAITPLTKAIKRGFKAAENEWDARDPIKVGVFYHVWSSVIRYFCEDYVRAFNAHPYARYHGQEIYVPTDLFYNGQSLGIPVHSTYASSLIRQLRPEGLGAHQDIEIIDAISAKCRESWEFMKRQGHINYELENTWALYRSLVRVVEASTLSTI